MDMPTAEDYTRAVQNPQVSFLQPNLKQARFEVHPLLGIPMPASGTSAIVFKATVDGQTQALRFPTRPDTATQQRYTALNRYFTERDLTRDVATSQWIDNAIVVNGRTWPMLRMQWVEGRTLNSYVENLVESEDTAAISGLADAWRSLLRRMQSARFAHGDLQHGNVMVEADGTLRLVDFDSAWIEPFAGTAPPSETGHRNYQRPGRPWGPWMDTFPGLVIYLSLLALSRNPKAWEQLHNGENLLFHGDDFTPPHETRAWWEIAQVSDPQLTAISSRLKACCAPNWTANTGLEDLLSAPLPWWTQTGTTAKPQPRSAEAAPVRTPRPVRPAVGAQARTPGTWWTGQPAPRQAPSLAPPPAPPVAAPRVRKWRTIVLISLLVWVVSGSVLAGLLPTDAGRVAAIVATWVLAATTFTVLAGTRKRPAKPTGRKR